MLDIISVFCRRDLAAQMLQVRSISRFLPDSEVGHIFLIYNDTFDASGDSLFQQLASSLPRNASIVHFSDLGVDAGSVEKDGWVTQQALKLEVSRIVRAENYLVLDAKNHFIAPAAVSDFICESGRLLGPMSSERDTASLMDALDYLQVPAHQRPSRMVLPVTPFVFKTTLARGLIDHLAQRENQSVTQILLDHRSLTEFHVYQAFLALNGQVLTDIYQDGPELGSIVWNWMAQYPEAFADTLRGLHTGIQKMFAIHWTAASVMDQEQVNEIASFWAKRGLVESVQEGANVLECTRTYLSEIDKAHLQSLAPKGGLKGNVYTFTARYHKNQACFLASLCDKYGSDKGSLKTSGHPFSWPPHTYTDVYSELFDHCREGVRKVFECGIGSNDPSGASSMGRNGMPGASLRVWRDYFPNAQIFGADIDEAALFEEDRIKTYFVDQCSPASIEALWNKIAVSDFDLIVDDGLHSLAAGITLFESAFKMLGRNGIYIIEDVHSAYQEELCDYFAERSLNFKLVELTIPGIGYPDNKLMLIRNRILG